MKRLFQILLLTLSLFVCMHTVASTTFIGNGGDGFLIQGQVYLSDLVLGGDDLYRNPWYGPDKSSQAIVEPELIERLGASSDLLERKLWDLDKIHPGLGTLVGDAIRRHHWTLTDLTLGTTCDRVERIIDSAASNIRHVQIANRYEGEVRLQGQHWMAMNEKQRVALIIHEGIYSILKQPFRFRGACPSAYLAKTTRRIVRLAFLPPTPEPKRLTSEMIQLLP